MKHEIINNEQLIRLAHSKKIKIHLSLKDRTWRNGYVVNVYPDFFEFQDVINSEETFFYLQLLNVEPFREVSV
jgi:hypothetical protein